MALTVNNNPPTLNLARNPVMYTLTSDNVYSTAGVATKMLIIFTSLPVNGNTLQLEYLNGLRNITLTFKNNPDDSGNEIEVPPSGSVSDWASTTFISELKRNYLIQKDWSIEYIGGTVYFTARTAGSAYDAIMTVTGSYSGGHDGTDVNGVDPVLRPNFRVLLLLDIKYSGETDTRAELELLPVNAVVNFNLQSLLGAYNRFNLPPSNGVNAYDNSSQVIEFTATFAEAYGDSLTVQRLHPQALRYALYGGFDLKDALSLTANDVSLNFLTHRLVATLIAGQPYFLSFINNSNTTLNAAVKYTLYYTDNTSEVRTLYNQSIAPRELYTFPVGDTIILNAADAVKEVDYATVQLTSISPNITTLPITLRYAKIAARAQVYLAYQNGYGVPEVWGLRGTVTKVHRVSQDTVEIQTEEDAPLEVPRFTAIENKQVYGFTLRTGYVPADEREYIAELLSSEQVYMISKGRYVPVQLAREEHVISDTDMYDMNSFTLEVRLATDKNYSDAGDRIE